MTGMITIAKNSNNIEFINFAYSNGIRNFRINMDYEEEAYNTIIKMSKLEYNDINIFADFQGVKMRIQLEPSINEIVYKPGDIQIFYINSSRFPFITNYEYISKYVKEGQTISISDGKIRGEVIKIDTNSISVKFKFIDYVLRQNAGCCFIGENIPETRMTSDACKKIYKSKIIEKKLINWVILSFVDSAEEIKDFTDNMHKMGIKVMAKIETKQGVNNMISISNIVDGLMIGRGDLKSTTNDEEFEYYYKKSLQSMKEMKNKYLGVGTFFLSHYSNNKELLDNEKNDIEHIKKIGLDYIMLSKEVVNSKYPYETLKKLVELCKN